MLINPHKKRQAIAFFRCIFSTILDKDFWITSSERSRTAVTRMFSGCVAHFNCINTDDHPSGYPDWLIKFIHADIIWLRKNVHWSRSKINFINEGLTQLTEPHYLQDVNTRTGNKSLLIIKSLAAENP